MPTLESKSEQTIFQPQNSCSLVLNPLLDDKILDWSILKQIADEILKCIKNEKKVPYRIENIVRKGDIACYKQFLLF